MGNRIIKESICTSASVDSLPWFEEVFFYRLIVNCDDFGRTDGRMQILKAKLFPLKDVPTGQIEAALARLQDAGMLIVYACSGQRYIQLSNWEKHQTVRNKKSRYPGPDAGEIIRLQLKSIEINCGSNPILSNVNPTQSNPGYGSGSSGNSVLTDNPVLTPLENKATVGDTIPREDWNPFGDAPSPLPTVESYIANHLPPMSPGNIDELRGFQDAGMQDDAIRFAVDQAAAQGKRTWAYVRAILRRWEAANIFTAGAARAAEDKHQTQTAARASPDGRTGPATDPRVARLLALAAEEEQRENDTSRYC